MLGHGCIIVEVGLNVGSVKVGEGVEELLDETPLQLLAPLFPRVRCFRGVDGIGGNERVHLLRQA